MKLSKLHRGRVVQIEVKVGCAVCFNNNTKKNTMVEVDEMGGEVWEGESQKRVTEKSPF